MRRLETLTNAELSKIFRMRNQQLEGWLKNNIWDAKDNCVYYVEAKRHSLLVMECLIELEARAKPNSEWDKPYLAATLKGE